MNLHLRDRANELRWRLRSFGDRQRDQWRAIRRALRYTMTVVPVRMARDTWGTTTELPRHLRHNARALGYWWRERNRTILIALAVSPVLLVTLSILFLAALMLRPDRDTPVWYQRVGARSLDKEDFATARLCYAALLQRQPDNPEYLFGLARSLAGLKELQGAQVLIARLAPEDRLNYGPAHLFVAEQLLRSPAPTTQMTDSAEQHLLRAIRADPKDQKAHGLLATLYLRTGRWQHVSDHLDQAGPQAGAVGLAAAQASAKRGDTVQALQWTRKASDFYSARAKKDPTDDDSRLKWAQATAMQSDFPGTIDILEAGWKQTNKPVYPRAIAQVTAWWLDHSQVEITRKLGIMEKGLRCDAQQPILLKLVIDPHTLNDVARVQPTTAPVAGAMMRALCNSVSACRKEDKDRARSELELALKLGGDTCATITANVAYTWAYADAPELESTLFLATLLRQLRPEDPMAARAQGLVLAKMQRWQECLACLEPIASAAPEDLKIHETLAVAYENTGKPDLAAKHRLLAQPPATAPTTGPSTLRATAPSAAR